MPAFNKLQPFAEAVYEKKHNLGSDQLKIALTNTAPSAAHAVLTDLTEVSYTNMSTRNITTSSSAQTSGTYKLICTDLVLTMSGGASPTFRYVYIYNDTATNDDLIGYYDYGVGGVTLADLEALTIDFDGTNGVLTHA